MMDRRIKTARLLNWVIVLGTVVAYGLIWLVERYRH